MRILQVAPTYFPAVRYGGPIRSVHGLASALAGRGHDVHVYTTSMDGAADLSVPTSGPVALDGVQVHYFPVPFARRLAFAPQLGAALAATVASFDVVHVHTAFLYPMYAAARAARRAGVPLVASPRGMLMKDAIAGRSARVKRAWIAAVERRTYSDAAVTHVTAQIEADELAHAGVRPRSVRVIANGVEIPARFEPAASGPLTTLPERYVLFLSRISWKKGLDRLVRAWPKVGDLHLVIAGNDDERYQGQIEKMVSDAGLGDRVRFVGAVNDADKWHLYREAQLFVLPSYAENFGNVVVEAMGVGCPVIVSEAVGAKSIVTAAGAGVVTSGDPDDLARDINRLAADAGTRAAMGARGTAYVQAHLGWPAIALSMESAYEEAIRASTRRPA